MKSLPRRLLRLGLESPSPRRAWIEIEAKVLGVTATPGRPPHGGRGLKSLFGYPFVGVPCRPPHGGRGLKLLILICIIIFSTVALPTEGVD